MAFEPGNQLAKKQRYVTDAIRRAVVQDNGAKLREIVDAQLELAAKGDIQAAVFIRDSLDGKPHQSSDVSISGTLQDTLSSIASVDVPE